MGDEHGNADQIHLSLPADPAYGRIARVAAFGLGLRVGLRFSQLEDLRLAVDETIILLLRPDGHCDGVRVTFTVEPGLLELVASATDADDSQAWPVEGAADRFVELVTGTVDEMELDVPVRAVRLLVRADSTPPA